MSHELLTTKEEFLTATKNSQYSVAVHVRSLNLMLTLKVTVDNCEKYNRNGRSGYGKILTGKACSNILILSFRYPYNLRAHKTLPFNVGIGVRLPAKKT